MRAARVERSLRVSAIFGFLDLAGRPAERRHASAMSDALARRAPAGSSIWVDGRLALGHGASEPDAYGGSVQQPSVHRPSGTVVAADARIDVAADLCRALGSGQQREHTTASFLAHAYLRWGVASVPELLGDFA